MSHNDIIINKLQDLGVCSGEGRCVCGLCLCDDYSQRHGQYCEECGVSKFFISSSLTLFSLSLSFVPSFEQTSVSLSVAL